LNRRPARRRLAVQRHGAEEPRRWSRLRRGGPGPERRGAKGEHAYGRRPRHHRFPGKTHCCRSPLMSLTDPVTRSGRTPTPQGGSRPVAPELSSDYAGG
jgi:hypothetical protein